MLTQQQHKDLRQAQAMFAHPNADLQEKALAGIIINRLTSLANQANQQPTQQPTATAPPQPTHHTPRQKTATRVTLNPTPKPHAPHPPLKVSTASPTRYQAHHTTVTIHWPTGERTYQYHQIRSRLYISLKNLIHSVANTGVTYKEIENYAAWGNAQTYYSAISEIWGHPPTFQELNFSPATLDLHALEEMFERVVKNDAP